MKRKKGISLIVLVIIIIVIVILAGSVILNLANNNPINFADKATYIGDLRNFQTELDFFEGKQFSDKPGVYDPTLLQADETSVIYDGTVDNTKTINDLIPSLGKATKYVGQFVVVDGKLVFKGTDTNRQDWSNEAGVVVQAVNRTFSGAITGFSYNNPVIPAGFVAVNTDDANWNNLSTDWDKGLVIQDASGNQFVWVPVDGTNVTYAKWCTTGTSYEYTLDDTLPAAFNENNITTIYKGFYIARYESAFDYNGGNIRIASKISTNTTITDWSLTRDSSHTGYLFNFVNYADSKTYSENMDTSYGYDTSKVETNLITGQEWDTTLKWIQNSGKGITDSTTWGNYSDSTSPANISGFGSLQISGYNNYWKANNIYDLAGNLWEWTNEIDSSGRVDRGGSYYHTCSMFPSDYRYGGHGINDNHFDVGFRTALYVL